MASSLCSKWVYHQHQWMKALQGVSTWCSLALCFIWAAVLILVGTMSEWESDTGYFYAPFQQAGILAFANGLFRKAFLTSLLRG